MMGPARTAFLTPFQVTSFTRPFLSSTRLGSILARRQGEGEEEEESDVCVRQGEREEESDVCVRQREGEEESDVCV